MKTLYKLSIASLFTLSIGACGSSAADELSSWKSAACKCEDKACADKQDEAFMKILKKHKDDDKPSKSDRDKLRKLIDEGQECLTKARG